MSGFGVIVGMGEYPRAILGGGKQAAHVLCLLEWMGLPWKECLLFDDCYGNIKTGARNLAIAGSLGDGIRACSGQNLAAIVALGSKHAAVRYLTYQRAVRAGISLVSVIHPSCVIAPTATIGANVVMMPGCIVGPGASLGNLCCLFSHVTVEHDCNIGDNVTMGPASTLSGFVKVGAHCFLGAGVICAPEVTIHERCLLGAGAVAVSDTPPDTVCVGVPAHVTRRVVSGDDVPVET